MFFNERETMVNRMMMAAAVCAAAVAFPNVDAHAKPVSATPFADNMVLQREMKVPVWGTAAPGEKVTVAFAGQTKETTADAKGAWRVTLDPMVASKEPKTMRIAGADGSEEIGNVLVGEVWFASGQSNMECPIWGGNPRFRDGNGALMVASTRRPFIRYAKNAKNCSRTPRLGWKAQWRDFSPESFKATMGYNLSAVAFYYALEIYGALDIPVGVVDSSWGGTRIEPWVPASTFNKDFVVPEKVGPQTPTTLWNGMVAGWAPMAMRGFIWYQGCSNAGEGDAYRAKMHLLYDGWAKEFENPGLSLYFVQLAPFSKSWFDIQLAQAKFAAEEKNAALVTTCDVGNFADIHPNCKEPVAKRLALHALKRDYGFANVIDESPTLSNWKIDDGKFVMSFDRASAWYAYNADRKVAEGFEVAGAEGPFVPAKIVNSGANGNLKGAELIVAADGVTAPRRLRYLASKPWIGSLYSADSGLPLGPFEIDARVPSEHRRENSDAKPGDALKVAELAGFRKILEADLPTWKFAGYSFDESKKAGAFSRVAYVLELGYPDGSVDWVFTAMDAFTDDAWKLGVPTVSKETFQRRVTNLSVRSNVKTVEEGNFAEGGVVEFFNTNYKPDKGLSELSEGDQLKYDFNDSPVGEPGGYGCMQVHNAKRGVTIFAYNHFNGGGVVDIGIGTNTAGEQPDWTFFGNASDYTTRRLIILVAP